MSDGLESLRAAALSVAGVSRAAFVPWSDAAGTFEASCDNGAWICPAETSLTELTKLDLRGEQPTWTPAPTSSSRDAGYLLLPLFVLGRPFGKLILWLDAPPAGACRKALSVLEIFALQIAAHEVRMRHTLRAEQERVALEEQRQRLTRRQDMLDATEEVGRTGSFRWRPQDGRQTWSRMNFVLHGYEAGADQPSYDMCIQRLHPDDRDAFLATVDAGTRAGRAIDVEYRLCMPDGYVRYALARAKPYIADEWVGSLVDVTELRESEDALRSTQMALARVASVTTTGELAAAIAHELNQPLTSMMANAGAAIRWLNRQPPNRERATSSMASVARDARRAGEVIRGLHALTHKVAPQFGPVSIDEVVSDIVALTRPDLSRKQIQLEVELQSAGQLVAGDKGQLQQVLLNLVSNAVDAMATNGERAKIVRIATRVTADRLLELSLADTGSGLDQGSSDKMFEAFYSTKSSGMGMGLAICRSIIERHRGTLEGFSRAPHGSVFRARLPLTLQN